MFSQSGIRGEVFTITMLENNKERWTADDAIAKKCQEENVSQIKVMVGRKVKEKKKQNWDFKTCKNSSKKWTRLTKKEYHV